MWEVSLEKRRSSWQNHNRHLLPSLSTRPCNWLKAVENRKPKSHENWAYRRVPCIPGVGSQRMMGTTPFLEKDIRRRWRRKITVSNENENGCNRSVIS